MKTGMMKLLAGAAISTWVIAAQAIPITGSISFGGTAVLGNESGDPVTLANATKFTSISAVVQFGASGSFSGVSYPTPATWSPFTFVPPTSSIVPLWTLTSGGMVFSFDSTSMTTAYDAAAGTLDIAGTGVAHIVDTSSNPVIYDDTAGTWTMTVTSRGTLFTFNDTTIIPPTIPPIAVPDGGMTLALLGTALSGLALLRRKLG